MLLLLFRSRRIDVRSHWGFLREREIGGVSSFFGAAWNSNGQIKLRAKKKYKFLSATYIYIYIYIARLSIYINIRLFLSISLIIISNNNTIKQRFSFFNLSPYLSRISVKHLQNPLFEIIWLHHEQTTGFRSQLQESRMSCHFEELWYNETVFMWMNIYMCVCVCERERRRKK